MNDLLDAYPIIEKLLPWIGGAIGGSLLTVLRNRRALLTYNVSHQKIGMTADDEIHGKVEVTYRGSVVHNLYLSVVTIKNHSFRDLEDLDLKTFRGGNDISLLTEQTHIEGTIEFVDLTKEYMDRIEKDSDWEKMIFEAGTQDEDANKKRLDADAGFRHGQRHYTVPVLNRGQTIRLTYLVAAAPNTSPFINVTTQTKGVRIKEKPYPQAISHLWGVPIVHAAIVGIVAGVIITGLVVLNIKTLWIAASVCFVVGVFGNVPGALLIKSYKWLRTKLIG